MQPLFRSGEGGVFILAYHLVGARTTSPVDIDVETFRHQMVELQQIGGICSLTQAVEALRTGSLNGTLKVVVTFDDAYENFYTHAWPVLSELNIPATLYVPVDFVSGNAQSPISRVSGLRSSSWSQLSEMVQSKLVHIGSHGCSHADLRKLDEKSAIREIADSQKILQDKTGAVVDSFGYPEALWSVPLEKMVRQYYQTAVIAGGRKMHSRNWNPLRLNRVPIRHDMPSDLSTLLHSSLWLEEFLASRVRLWS